jgi:sarcosine oxidase, subunit gamma
MSEIVMESPLVLARRLQQSNALPEAAGIRLGERPFIGLINLRARADAVGLAKTGKVLGARLPTEPNTRVEQDGNTVCWLGPDEWLVLTPAGEQAERIAQLRDALDGQFAAVTDVSGGYALISVAGPDCRDLLAKGCTLDLHPRAFQAGQCAQTLLAKAGVLLITRDDESIDLLVRRSFADYLWHWLVDAAEEYGLAVV